MAQAIWKPHGLYLADSYNYYWRDADIRLRLITGTADYQTALGDLISRELAQADSYAPTLFDFGNGAWDATDRRYEAEVIQSLTVTANKTWRTAMAWRNGSTTANKSISAVNTGTSRITVTAHGITDGDALVLTADSGGTQFPNVTATQVVYGKSIDADTIEVYTNAGLTTLANLAGGVAPLRCRFAKGMPLVIATFDSDQTLLATVAQPFRISVNRLGAGVAQGVV